MNFKKGYQSLRNGLEGKRSFLLGFNPVSVVQPVERNEDDTQVWSCHLPFEHQGTLFLYTSYPDIAENDEHILINLGVTRDRLSGEVLLAKDLIQRNLVSTQNIEYEMIGGNPLIVCVSKNEPRILFYRGVIGTNTLMYSCSNEMFICSDALPLIIPFLDRAELSRNATLPHLLFRTVHGSNTYIQDIYRLEHGHIALWSPGGITSSIVQDLRNFHQEKNTRIDETTIADFRIKAEAMVASYTRWLANIGSGYANLLSGGVDSSVLQYLINSSFPDAIPARSFSYAMLTRHFEHEAIYARSASEALNTFHEVVDIRPDDFPDLLVQTIKACGQPIGHESMPCQLALAKYIADHYPEIGSVFMGVAADTLLGTESSKRLMQLDSASNIMFADYLLQFGAWLIKPFMPNKAYGFRDLSTLIRNCRNPDSLNHPLIQQALFTDISIVEESFGIEAVHRACVSKRTYGEKYLGADTHIEKVHALQLVALVADEQPLISRIYNNSRLQLLSPYLDYTFLEATFSFDPRIRFYAQGRTKPIIKYILEKNTPYPDVDKPKGHSGFDIDLKAWMRKGVLRDMVQAIERPSFMKRKDFERILEQPDWLTWNMLTLDLFQQHVLGER